MHAKNAPCVLACRTRFSAETWCPGSQPQRQIFFLQNFFPNIVRQRHFGRGYEPVPGCGTKEILFEFRQLTRAESCFIADKEWRGHLAITEFPGMQIQHEIAERA